MLKAKQERTHTEIKDLAGEGDVWLYLALLSPCHP